MQTISEAIDVSRETIQNLQAYVTLLKKWTQKINLIAPDTIPVIWDRHILDSAQMYPILPLNTKHLVDLGSGGGLPALVLAIIAKEKNPTMAVTMVESDVRKCTFLSTVNRELKLNARVTNSRIADVPSLMADVITARALAALPELLSMIDHHLAPGGMALLPKGKNHRSEIDLARKNWHMSVLEHPSITEPQARILEVKDITRATPQS